MLREFSKRVSMLSRGPHRRKPVNAGSRLARGGRLALEMLEPRWMLDGGPLVISEFMADNDDVLADGDGDFSDWIEIHNPTDAAVDLDGWYLTDDPADLTKWQFPEVAIEAGGYQIVFASDKAADPPPGELHANFKLGSEGEYLALVRYDGTTVSHDFSPAFPEQFTDVSYGLVQDVEALVAEGGGLSYLVPTSAEAPLGTTWTAPNFGDWTWNGGVREPTIVITEAGTGDPDFVEVQNVSGGLVDTAGWVVVANNADDRSGPPDINAWHTTLWELPSTMGAGEVLYRSDINDGTGHYWGDNIFWRTAGNGWAMILDAAGNVADFAVWGYEPAEIASMNLHVNGFDVTVGDAWIGEAIAPDLIATESLQRTGDRDNDDADDWAIATPISMGSQNAGLTVPFVSGGGDRFRTGIGFNMDAVGFDVTYYKANVAVNSLSTAEQVLRDPSLQSAVATEIASVINYENTDPGGHYGNNSPFPGTTLGNDVDDFVVEATAVVEIPTAGPWTFGVNSNDGFGLELTNGTETFAASYPGPRQAADTLEVFHVTEPGQYELRLVYFERDGGSGLELFAAQGDFGSFDPGAFDLLGDTAGGGLGATRFGDAIRTDVEAEMRNVNASLWTRIRFDLDDPSAPGRLQLRMKYNDGFVAYLNGQEIARRHAPPSPAWDSSATAARSLEESMAYEEINVSQFLGALRPGKNVLAVHGLNVAADDEDFLILPELIGVATQPTEQYFAVPTPGGPNGTSFTDFVKATTFSVEHGFFENPISVVIGTATPGATIRYTTDGSQPTEASGTLYTGPLVVSSTTTLRAAAFKSGYQPSRVATQTYVSLDDVLQQSPGGTPPSGWPTGPVGSQVLDYGMDPDIVDDPLWEPQLESALASIPTMSLVTDLDNLFDPATGIYVNAHQDGADWERPTSLELIYPDGTQGFQIDAGLRIRGGFTDSQANPKHAFRLFFRDEYGAGKLEYPLFGDEGVESFDKLDLRTAQDYSWSFDGSGQFTMVRDVFSRDTQAAMDQPYTRSRYYHLYINGQYWGLYQTQERSEAAYGESYFGGSRQDYDVIKVSPEAGYTIAATDGNLDAWQELWNQANAGFATDAAYYRAQGLNPDGTRNPAYPVLLDVDNLIDYMLVILYTGNQDGPISALRANVDPNNFFAVRDRNGEEGFQFFVHDAEHTLSLGEENRNGPWSAGDEFLKSNPQWIHQQLMAHPEYRLRFADGAHDYLLHDGLLTADAAAARWTARAEEIETAIVAESARWGDAQAATPLDQDDWLAAINNELTGFFAGRSQVLLDQLANTTLRDGTPAPLYPDVVAPTYSQHGGQVDEGYQLTMSAPSGAVYYTLDGSDPRLPGGAVSPTAVPYNNTAITINESTVVKARALDGGEWSALSRAGFFVGVPAAAANLAIVELNYNPHDPTTVELAGSSFNNDDFEFLELSNTSGEKIDLTGVAFSDGIDFAFSGSNVTKLPAGESVVIVSNLAAFEARYGTAISVAGQYSGNLDNGGEQIVLRDRLGQPIRDFAYDDADGWPERADGGGSSLELIDTGGNYSAARNWRASSKYGGSPGGLNVVRAADVVVNEVLSQPLPGDLDAIELYNPTGGPIDVAGWYLSDSSGNCQKFRIPDGPAATIAAGQFLVFDEDDFNASGGVDPNDFALDADGDEVWLLQSDANGDLWFADHAAFGAALPGVSFGRWPDGSGNFVMMSEETLGLPNSPARAGAVIINEMHVDPDVKTELVEYIELYNRSDYAVDLSGWYFSAGVTYTFPNNTQLPPGGYVVVAQSPAAVLARFGVSSLGPFLGKLVNEGERVVLRDPAGIVQDEVTYGQGFPWPVVGDPPGYSMELVNPVLDNELAGSWRASYGGPTPGRSNSVLAANAPPHLGEIAHTPRQPVSGEDVAITIQVTDADGVASVTLDYQLVDPGNYINIDDSRYNHPAYWTTVVMHDDGVDGDAYADDDVYTVVLPGSLQTHRRLVRYRVAAEDTLGASVAGPYPEDPQPNFAYFVYDAIPSWTGSARPGVQPNVTYSSELLQSVPVYQLLTTRQHHEDAMHIPYSSQGGYGGSEYLWQGTLVYDGQVYDHIRYRARGGVWRYAMGKNMWKFDFNKGHYFQSYDDYGVPYGTTRDKLNFSAIIQQGDYWHRGEHGLFEAVGFKLFNLAGVESPSTNYIHFRIVEDADEGGPNQFSTDFQGMYLVIEQPDGRMLDEHGLPDGNFYKMEGGTGELNNQGPTQPTNKSDLNAFMSTYSSWPSEQWWRDNFELEKYYSYRSIVESIHHYDIAYGKNYFYYHNPDTGTWSIHPWDLDLTWANNMYGSGNHVFKSVIADRSEFRAEYRSRMREIRDLLYNPEQTGMLIDEMAQVIYTPGQPSLVDADCAMWDFNPILVSGYVNSSKAGHDRFYRPPGFSGKGTFADMIQLMKNYIVSRGAWIDSSILDDENLVPDTPTATYVGEAGYPVDGLTFQTSPFGSSSGSFAALQWRIARVTDPNSPDFDPTQPRHYEITSTWQSDEITTFNNTITIPGQDVTVGETYRVRVRMKDTAGHWGHWSDPVQLTAGSATGPLAYGLRITELNYNPHPPTAEELNVNPNFDNDDFEFIELHNTAGHTLDLTGVALIDGVDFDFTGSSVTTLGPDEYVVVVKDLTAFVARYGTQINVAGVYDGQLKNEGERVILADSFERTILDFSYDNTGSWPDRAEGLGSSLEIIDTHGSYGNADNWRPSVNYGGSPGRAGDGPLTDVVVNEVLSHTDPPDSDAIELHNTTDEAIDVGGWYVSDSADNYRKFRIPDGTSIPAHGYVVYNEDDFNPTWNDPQPDPGPNDFALNGAHGDDVWLLKADTAGKLTHFVDHVEFGAAANGESWGRWPNGVGDLYPMLAPTLDKEYPEDGENSGPRIGPVLISEVHYNPKLVQPDDDLEFIEIYNSTDQPVDLTGWRIREGVDYDFPADTILQAHAVLVIVPFDLGQTGTLEAFRSEYGIVGQPVYILGGYVRQLNDDGEKLQLQRPDEEPADEPGFIPYLLEDEVIYGDTGAWPAEADGYGSSLNRLRVDAWGNAPASWNALLPTPGSTTLVPQEAEVVGHHVFYNHSAFDGNSAAPDAQDDGAIASDKEALLPGNTATFANYTSYGHGINGIMVDVDGLPEWAAPGVDDFQFRAGNSDNPGSWAAAAAPSSITVRRGAGTGDSDRITLIWPDNAIQKQWLQVTVLATANTALAGEDVFYFGNAIGESGNSATDAKVNATDMLAARNNQRTFINPAPIDFDFDYDRDARVNATDMLIARNNQTNFLSALKLISVPAGKAAGILKPASKQFSIDTDLPQVDGVYRTTEAVAALYGTASPAETGSVLVGGELAQWSPAEGTWSYDDGGGVPLWPGINRILVETFEGPDGTGSRLEYGDIDVWYDDGSESTLAGTLGDDTVLDAASGPWRVTGDVTVPAGRTLTIEPGTTVFFNQATGVQVDGRLVAEGTKYERIRLGRRPGSGVTWDGLYFDSAEDNRLSYADMEYSTTRSASIDLDDSRILMDNVTWAGTNETVLSISRSSLIVRNSVFPGTSAQTVSGSRLLGSDPYMLFENNVFGVCTGYKQDVLDFTTNGAATMPRFIGNVFLGGGDDALDLDGTDAYVEGNVFMNFHRNFTPTEGESYGVSTGYDGPYSSHHVIVRNLFIDCDNAALVKDRSWIDFENNTVVRCGNGINFNEPQEGDVEAGLGGYLDGNIFWATPTPIATYYVDDPVWGTTDITIHRSIVPAEYHDFGVGNLDADPLLADPDNLDVSLLPGSPAIGSGPNGIDMGAMVSAGASISGEPPALTHQTEATLTIAGPGIRHYKYRLNDGAWSAEAATDSPIELTGLTPGEYTVYVIGKNAAGDWQSEADAAESETWIVVSPVVGRYVFYNHSAFDGDDAGADPRDDDAVAVNKQALLPGETATFANYTSYTCGINGIMVDVDGLPEMAAPGVDDFQFRAGNSDTPGSWAVAAAPSSITVRRGAGSDGSDRITLIWPDNAIQKQWLQVTVLATANTGLAGEDVFYFGNAIGESGNSATEAKVNATDMLAARNNQRNFLNPAPIDFDYDYDRDARVNATDMLIARNNQTSFLTALNLISVPQRKALGEEAASMERLSPQDAVLEQAAMPQSDRRERASGKLAWLYEFEQISTRQRSPQKDDTGKPAAVDLLLADLP